MGDVIRLMMHGDTCHYFCKGQCTEWRHTRLLLWLQELHSRVPRMHLWGKADLDNPLHRCLWICMA
jgi:hypothetical protein